MYRAGLCIFALGFVLAAEPPAGADPARTEAIAARLKTFSDQRAVAGTVTLFSLNGAITHHEALGVMDIESGKPMQRDSIFQIMSMTKPMVGAAILMLAEEGRLSLHDAVEKHLPEFRGQRVITATHANGSQVLAKPARPITIRDLLTHTSGLPEYGAPALAEIYRNLDRPLAEVVLLHSQLPLLFEPGTKWQYSNPGIATLGRIIEVISAMPFEQFLAARLWTPLGMKDTFIFPPQEKLDRIAMVHASVNGKLQRAYLGQNLNGAPWEHRRGAKYSFPEGGAYSTALDLHAFYEMFRNGGVHKGRRILAKASVEAMSALHTGDIKAGHNPGAGFGLTFEVVKENLGTLNFFSRTAYGHGGAFGTHGWIDPERGVTGVYLVQGGLGEVKQHFMRLANASIE